MIVNKKSYHEIYYQLPENISDSTQFMVKTQADFNQLIKTKYSYEEIAHQTKEIHEDLTKMAMEYILDIYYKKYVGVRSSYINGEYYIFIHYENGNNKAKGEDL